MKRGAPDYLTLWLMGPAVAREAAAVEVEKWMRASSRGSRFLGRAAQDSSPLGCAAVEISLRAKPRPNGRPGFDLRRWQTLLGQRHPNVTVLMCWTDFKNRACVSVNNPMAMARLELWPCAAQPNLVFTPRVWITSTTITTTANGLASYVSFSLKQQPHAQVDQRGLATTGLSMMSGEALTQIKCFMRVQVLEVIMESNLPVLSESGGQPVLERL